MEVPRCHLQTTIGVAVNPKDADSIVKCIECVEVDGVVGHTVADYLYACGGKIMAFVGFVETVTFHFISGTVVQDKSGVARSNRRTLQVERVTGDCDITVRVDSQTDVIVAEFCLIDRDRVGVACGDDLHGGVETGEETDSGDTGGTFALVHI